MQLLSTVVFIYLILNKDALVDNCSCILNEKKEFYWLVPLKKIETSKHTVIFKNSLLYIVFSNKNEL